MFRYWNILIFSCGMPCVWFEYFSELVQGRKLIIVTKYLAIHMFGFVCFYLERHRLYILVYGRHKIFNIMARLRDMSRGKTSRFGITPREIFPNVVTLKVAFSHISIKHASNNFPLSQRKRTCVFEDFRTRACFLGSLAGHIPATEGFPRDRVDPAISPRWWKFF